MRRRLNRLRGELDRLVSEDRMSALQVDFWLPRVMADESLLALLNQWPQRKAL